MSIYIKRWTIRNIQGRQMDKYIAQSNKNRYFSYKWAT